MADVITGYCRTLPGSAHRVPAGTKCDNHPERIAVSRLQGHTDDNGAALHDLCSECRAEFSLQLDQPQRLCEVCNRPKDDLQRWRDPADGVAGPVYQACGECRERGAAFHRNETEEGDPVNPEEQDERDLIASMVEKPADVVDRLARRKQQRRPGLIAPTAGYVDPRSGFLGVPVRSPEEE